MTLLPRILALALLPLPALAEEAQWLQTGALSYHFSGHFNGRNEGLGVEVGPWQAGVYKNSISKVSHYAAWRWTALERGEWKAGLLLGAVDGYNLNHGRVVPAVIPTLSWEGQSIGVNLLLIPQVEKGASTALAIQLKWRL